MIEEREEKQRSLKRTKKDVQWIPIDDFQKPMPYVNNMGTKSTFQSVRVLLANVADNRFEPVEIGIYLLEIDEFRVSGCSGGDMTPTHWAYFPDVP